ncbi:MAG: outer membrane protein assembly factor BamE [Granulosicoccus sp.]
MRKLTALLLLILLSACGGNPPWLPRAHQITIQQGNVLSQELVDQVSVGMSREEIRSLIGMPLMQPTFRDDRWDYVYTRGPAGSSIAARRLSIFFENQTVVSIESNQDQETGERPARRYFWEKKTDT